MRRLGQALVSAAALLATLVGVPCGLVVAVGWPLPTEVPDLAEAKAWLVQQPTLPTIIDGAACGLWLLWAWSVHAVASAAIVQIRHRRATPTTRRGLRLATPLHAVASSAVGSLVLTTSTAAPAAIVASADHVTPATGVANADSILNEASPPSAQQREPVGVSVPRGGWLPDAAAAIVSGLGARVWVARRVRYRPRHPADPVDDTDLAALPAVVAALRRRMAAPEPDDTQAAGDAVRVWDVTVEAGAATASVATIGERDGRPLTLADLPAAGVGLVGPAANDAARAVMTMGLLASTTVHSTVDDVEDGFGPDRVPRLVSHPTFSAALAELEHHAHPPTPTPAGGLLLVTEAPDPQGARRLDVLVQALPALRVVLIGACPGRATWHVHRDGHVRTGTNAAAHRVRLGMLDMAAARDLLTALAEVDDTGAARPTSSAPGPSPRASPVPGGDALVRAGLRLRLLGSARLTTDDGQDVRIQRSAGSQILLYLAVHRDGATTDEIKEALWPDVASSLAARRFNTTMSELRQHLHAAAGAPIIGQHRDLGQPGRTRHYLDPHRIDVDLWRLEDATARAATASGAEDTAAALLEVIASYQGELAEGSRWEWIQPHREAAHRRMIDAYAHLAETEPDHHQALDLLQRAIRLAPHNEALYQLAMRHHGAIDDPDAARLMLQALAEQLRAVHRDPSEQTRRLADQLPPSAHA